MVFIDDRVQDIHKRQLAAVPGLGDKERFNAKISCRVTLSGLSSTK